MWKPATAPLSLSGSERSPSCRRTAKARSRLSLRAGPTKHRALSAKKQRGPCFGQVPSASACPVGKRLPGGMLPRAGEKRDAPKERISRASRFSAAKRQPEREGSSASEGGGRLPKARFKLFWSIFQGGAPAFKAGAPPCVFFCGIKGAVPSPQPHSSCACRSRFGTGSSASCRIRLSAIFFFSGVSCRYFSSTSWEASFLCRAEASSSKAA